MIIIVLSFTPLRQFNSSALEGNIDSTFDRSINLNVTDSDIDKEYWNWANSRTVKETPDPSNPSKETECLLHTNEDMRIVILLNPYFLGKISQKCAIPAGYHIIIPLYAAECDIGQIGSEKLSFKELLVCAKES